MTKFKQQRQIWLDFLLHAAVLFTHLILGIFCNFRGIPRMSQLTDSRIENNFKTQNGGSNHWNTRKFIVTSTTNEIIHYYNSYVFDLCPRCANFTDVCSIPGVWKKIGIRRQNEFFTLMKRENGKNRKQTNNMDSTVRVFYSAKSVSKSRYGSCSKCLNMSIRVEVKNKFNPRYVLFRTWNLGHNWHLTDKYM
jgi:hypothetical protein